MLRPLGLALAFVILWGAAPARADKDDDRVAGVKFKVFELKHRSPEDVMRVIRPLASGGKGTAISESSEFRTITVRDFPENIAAIEEALKRLDVPAPPKPDVELRLRVLVAAPSGPSNVPNDLEPVVKQLRATLNYKSYSEVASVTQRVLAGRGAKGKSPAQIGPPVTAEPSTLNYSYGFEDVNVGTGNHPQVQIRKLFFWMGNKHLGEADVNTGITLKEGEKVVVGTASLKDRALILVLSARVIR